jgi:uncharacterized membrane protein
MKDILTRLAALLSIKSLVTVISTIAFVILALKGVLSGEQFLTIFSVIIAFYFGTQATKEK